MPPSPAAAPRWHVPDPSALLFHQWLDENDQVVCNLLSGDIHLLTSEAIALVKRLCETPASLDELAGTVSAERPAIESLLASLDRLGLIGPLLS